MQECSHGHKCITHTTLNIINQAMSFVIFVMLFFVPESSDSQLASAVMPWFFEWKPWTWGSR